MKDYTVPLTLISILADAEFHSGEQLGERLGMSRAAINKHIQTLRDWGVDVFTVPGKGYSLPEPIQLLDEEQIARQTDLANCNRAMPAWLSISRQVAAAAGASGSRRLVLTFTFQCTGDWSRALLRL